MRFSTRFAPLLLVALLITGGCAGGATRPAGGATPQRAEPSRAATLTILHFNDIYEITPIEGGRVGGLARVATFRRQLADSVGAVVTTLGGDYLSPSALGTALVDGQRLAGRQMVAVLNAVGLDWAVPGNHEFDITEEEFHARVAESRFRIVASNVTDSAGRPFPGIVSSAIVETRTGGRTVRLGVLGLTIDSNRRQWVRYSNPLDAARREVARLRDSVDAIVALTHLSVRQDQELAEEVPGIDVILGGHEHENYLLRRGAALVPIVKGDANVRTVAVVRLAFGHPGDRPRIDAELVPITDRLRDDPTTAAIVRRWVDAGYAGYRALGLDPEAVVTTLTAPLDGRESTVRNRSGSLSDLILRAMHRAWPDAEVAVFNGGSIRIDDVVPTGPITQYDVIRILPFGGNLVRAEISGALLQRMLRSGRANVGTGGFLHASGAALDSAGMLTVGGAPADPARFYRVVTSDFLLTGGERGMDYLTRSNPEVRGATDLRDVRLALIEELGGR